MVLKIYLEFTLTSNLSSFSKGWRITPPTPYYIKDTPSPIPPTWRQTLLVLLHDGEGNLWYLWMLPPHIPFLVLSAHLGGWIYDILQHLDFKTKVLDPGGNSKISNLRDFEQDSKNISKLIDWSANLDIMSVSVRYENAQILLFIWIFDRSIIV